MNKRKTDGPKTSRKPHAAGGFSIIELVIVMAVIAIASTFALIGFSRSRKSISLQNSARVLASYAEKARLDAIRRHDATNLDITGPDTYLVTMDFDGTGVVSARSFSLEKGIVFTDSTNTAYAVDGSGTVSSSNGEAVSWADFNWRGRTAQCSMMFRMQNSNSEQSLVQVAGSGDVTIDTSLYVPAALIVASVNTSDDVATSTVISGTVSHFELYPCSVSGGGGTYSLPPVSTCTGGSIGSSVGSVSIRKNGASTASVNITVTGPGTITTTVNPNLQVTPATQSVSSSSGGTFAFSIKSITKLRASNPPFTVVFNNPCSSVTTYVTVTN
jgi:prepilin-type N-terminal cleavage/methylation domain-containing protein